jgi:hypothetical protein
VRLFAYRGRIEILSEKVYEERRQDGSQTTEADINTLEIAGMN